MNLHVVWSPTVGPLYAYRDPLLAHAHARTMVGLPGEPGERPSRTAAKRYLHVVWSLTVGPLYAYRDPMLAHAHARTMVGVDVDGVELRDQVPGPDELSEKALRAIAAGDLRVDRCEPCETLPDHVKDDIDSEATDYDDEEVTPVDVGFAVLMDDIDDADGAA